MMKTLVALLLVALWFTADSRAEGPEFDWGSGKTFSVVCDPPTTREPNSEGVRVPIDIDSLDHNELYIHQGAADGPVIAGPIIAGVDCSVTLNIDDYPSGQNYVRSTAVDSEGLISPLSDDNGPFLSVVPLAPSSAPTNIRLVPQDTVLQ
jgi:hypothetical protein